MTRFALKENDQFLVTDELGDISGVADGLFRCDTRISFLRVGALASSLLSSWVSHDNVYFRAHVTNSPLAELSGVKTPVGRFRLVDRYRDELHLEPLLEGGE